MLSDTAPLLAGRYQLHRLVAQGGRGDVWLGTDTALARPVAVKIIRTECACDEAAVGALRLAAQQAGSLVHENLARIYDFDEDGVSHLPYLVMEYADGPSLDRLAASGPLPPARAMAVIAQIAAGLGHVHAHGLVHGAVEPRNVLINKQFQVKLIGLGSRQRTASCDPASSKPSEVAPGTAPGAETGAHPGATPGAVTGSAADLDGLGVIARLCLTGASSGADASAGTPAVAHRRLPAALDPDVAAFVAALTTADGSRPASAAEIAERAGQLRDRLAGEVAGASGMQAGGGASNRQRAAASVRTVGPASRVTREPASARARPAAAVWSLARHPDPTDAASLPVVTSALASTPTPRTGSGPAPAVPISRLDSAAEHSVLAPVPGPFHRARRWRLASVTLCSFAAVGLMVGAAGLLGHHPARALVPPARTVLVNGAALRDRPVSAVRTRLTTLGLHVLVDWRVTSTIRPGLVISVRPGGRVAVGSLVTVFGARPVQDGGYAQKTGGVSSGPHHQRARSKAHHGPSATVSSPPAVTDPAPAPTTVPPANPSPTPTGSPAPSDPPSSPPPSSPPPSGSPSPTGSANAL